MSLLKVGRAARITLPAEVREALGEHEGVRILTVRQFLGLLAS